MLQHVLERFITLDALKEVGHGMDILVNESLNNTISWVTPKNKTYLTTQSLRNRISVAVGINALGIYTYFARLFRELGIDLPEDVAHCLKQVDARQTYRINKSQEIEQKKKRQESFHKTLVEEHTERAKKQRCKREGSIYQPGIGMGNPTNKLCKHYKPSKRKEQATPEELQAQLERDAKEQDIMDSLPFIDGDDEFFDSFEGPDDMDDDDIGGATGEI